MNLSEERRYQKLFDTLDAMELSETNRQLAEQYLDVTKEEDRTILTKTEHQDFSGLTEEKRRKCTGYVEHCTRRGRTEELGRFVRFAAASGGSTAYYVLLSYGWNLNSKLEFLTREQAAAIRAEGMVWKTFSLRNSVSNLGQKNPDILFRAMELCYHKHPNARVLLAAAGLYYTKPDTGSGPLGAVFSANKLSPEAKKAVAFLEDTVIATLPNMFGSTNAPSDEEIKKLQEFVRNGKPKEAFPQEISSILFGKIMSEYLVTLLAGAAFLAIEHSAVFVSFLRLAVAMDAVLKRTTTLDICLEIGDKAWFFSHIAALEESLPISRVDYVLWCLERKADSPLERAVKRYPEAVSLASEKVSVDAYQRLMEKVRKHNPALFRKMNAASSGTFRVKMAEELTDRYAKGKVQAKQYLLGEAEIDTLYPFVKEWREGWDYDTRRCSKIQQLKKNSQEQQMYRRAVVLEAMCMRARYFRSYWKGSYRMVDREEILEMFKIFEEEKLPVSYQIESLGGIYNDFYQEKEKNEFINECVKVLRLRKKDWRTELAALAGGGPAVVRFLCIRVLDSFAAEYKEVLLSCAADSSKQVRELLVAVYTSHKEWEPEMRTMLTSRKSQEREMAALVLKKWESWGGVSYREDFEAALAAEKSKKIRELLQSCLGEEAESSAQATPQSTEQLVKDILKGGKKRKIAWVWEAALPKVHKPDGTLVSEDELSALLVSYADMGVPGVSADASRLSKEMDPEELASFVGMVFSKWLEDRAEAKKKWVLYAASIHGGEKIIPALHSQIQEWPKNARGAMAAEAVKALALNGSSAALLLVDQISRKFKFRQVKAAAGEALSYAAEQLGITRAELEDRIVPNLGFDERMEQTFDYGTRSFKVILNAALELEIYDENDKKLKNLPAPGKKDEPEKAKAASDAFKLLKKQLKTVVSNQKIRLDQAMSTERLWQVEQWKDLFVKNPVMHQFAMGLIWGLYENGELKDTFRYMEDGTFNTVDEDEYDFPDAGTIGLIHPIELDADTLAAWKEQLSDYEVTQPIEQLERPVYQITEEEKKQRELTRFGGKLLNGLSLSGKLQGQGWYRGSVQDAGVYMTFYREDAEIGVELEFSGCYVADENEEVTVYGAKFYKAGTVKRGSYVYDTVKEQHQYKLGEVSPRYFSEIVLQLTKATASSREQLAYPACKER